MMKLKKRLIWMSSLTAIGLTFVLIGGFRHDEGSAEKRVEPVKTIELYAPTVNDRPHHSVIKPRQAVEKSTSPQAIPPEPVEEEAWEGDPVYARELVDTLFGIRLKDKMTVLTDEQVNDYVASLSELLAQGDAAVPAIRDFLESGEDLDLGALAGARIAYRSLRTAFIDILHQIGGDQAVDVMMNELRTTAEPKEIAMIARSLELHERQFYPKEIAIQAKDTLKFLNEGSTSLLFQVLGRYGDADTANVLDDIYLQALFRRDIAHALSIMKNGAGIPMLIKLAEYDKAYYKDDPKAVMMIAQAVGENYEAEQALLQLAQDDMINRAGWLSVATALGGNQYQANDDFFTRGRLDELLGEPPSMQTMRLNTSMPATWTDDEINAHIRLITALIYYAPDDTVAQNMEIAKNQLISWLKKPYIDGKRTSGR